MVTIEKSIVIDAPIEQVFAYFGDPAYASEYLPGVDGVKDIQRLSDGRYTWTLVTGFLGMHVDIKSEQVKVVPHERIVEKGHGGGIDGTVTTRFEGLENGETRVTVVNENILHAGPLGKFGEAFLARYFDRGEGKAMEAAKSHIEARTLAAMSR